MEGYIILGIILILALLSKNTTLCYAVIIVLLFSLLSNNKDNVLKTVKSKSLTIGLIFISVYILVPVAMGNVGFKDLLLTSTNKIGVIGLISGILVSILSTKGISIQSDMPQLTITLMIGTIIGILFFKGTASGPIIAGGITYTILYIIDLFTKNT